MRNGKSWGKLVHVYETLEINLALTKTFYLHVNEYNLS